MGYGLLFLVKIFSLMSKMTFVRIFGLWLLPIVILMLGLILPINLGSIILEIYGISSFPMTNKVYVKCTFSLLYFFLLLLIIHIIGVVQLIKMESWHPIIRVLSTALTCQFLSCLTEMVHYLIYMNDGIGSPDLKALGDLLSMITQIVLMFLCILVAKGWAITTSYLSDRNILIVTMSLLLLSYLSLFISDNAARDPASTLYFYDSVPGLIVIILRIGVAAWFLWCLRSTVGFEALPEKRRFYIIFGFCYTAWFLLLPGIVALALGLSEWVRFRVVSGLSLTVDAIAFIAFVVLLSPSRAVSFFNIKSTPQLLSEHDKPGYGTAKAFTEDL